MSGEVNVIQRTQRLIVDMPTRTVAVISAGPIGPTGPQGPAGPASTVPGPKGDKGDKGDPGAQGAASTVPGPQGPPGTSAARQLINPQTTSYTLVLADENKLVTLTNGVAVTLTVPTNAAVAFPIGSRIDIGQLGAGKVTVAGAGGVSVVGTPALGFRAQYSAASLIKTGTDAWLLVGDLA